MVLSGYLVDWLLIKIDVYLCSSFCRNHRPKQSKDCVDSPSARECSICLTAVRDTTGLESLKTPCCKNAWFHRDCFQVIVRMI